MKPKVSVIIPVYNVEKYVKGMLTSVANQSMGDFEAVIINDGSTDRSLSIIEAFCERDGRFAVYSQENQGVAMARNAGLDRAEGEYVVFYDPDDFIPENALQVLCSAMDAKKADIVIGIMETVTGFQPRVGPSIRRLAAAEVIHTYHPSLVANFSLANKMFRRDLIEMHGLRFDDVSYSEDGAFVFKCLLKSQKIVGCNEKVYTYYLRPFWEDPSITQSIRLKKLEDALKAYRLTGERIKLRIAEDQNQMREENLSEEAYEKMAAKHTLFLNRFYRRVVSQNLIKGFYRRIWRAQENIFPTLTDAMREMKAALPPAVWDSIKAMHPDLDIDALPSPAEIAEHPEVTFIVTEKVDPKQLEMVLKGIYYQEMPLFEVLVEASLQSQIPEVYRNVDNLHCYEKDSMDPLLQAKGRFVNVIRDNAFHTANSIKKLYAMLNSNCDNDFAMAEIKRISEDGHIVDIPLLSMVYEGECESQCGVKLDKLDCCLSNKLFRRDALLREGMTTAVLLQEPVAGIYDRLRYLKTDDEFLISYDLSNDVLFPKDDEILETLKADQKVISGKLQKAFFHRVTLPAYYKKECGKAEKPEDVVFLEGEGPLLSSGLEAARQGLLHEKGKTGKVYFVKDHPCHPFRQQQLCSVLAKAAVVYTNSPGALSRIKLRNETKLVIVTEEERVSVIKSVAETRKPKRKLVSKYPQAQKKKVVFIHTEKPLAERERIQLKKSLGKGYICVLWNETKDAYADLMPYDAAFVHANSFLTKEEAIYLCNAVISFKESDLKIGKLLQKPIVFCNGQLSQLESELKGLR